MSLHDIVAVLGGDLYQGGARASVPAPGHSAADRSVSLLLGREDRLVVHCFGDADWRTVLSDLQARGLVDLNGRLTGGAAARSRSAGTPRPDAVARLATARRIWAGATDLAPASLSSLHLALRAIRRSPAALQALRHHPAAPVSIYRPGRATRPALIAAITDGGGILTAVEITYLAPNGRRDGRLTISRKMVGLAPPGAAVRLDRAGSTLLVGEGVMTVLSAADHFGLPAWALLTARNLAVWRPPAEVTRVLIAADRGAPGETAAAELLHRLGRSGVRGAVALPPGRAEDWNAWAMAQRRREGR